MQFKHRSQVGITERTFDRAGNLSSLFHFFKKTMSCKRNTNRIFYNLKIQHASISREPGGININMILKALVSYYWVMKPLLIYHIYLIETNYPSTKLDKSQRKWPHQGVEKQPDTDVTSRMSDLFQKCHSSSDIWNPSLITINDYE